MASQQNQPKPAAKPAQALAVSGPRLPYIPEVQERFGISRSDWKALVEVVHPNAQTPGAVVLALAYCKARGLDPFKKVVHIVPIWDKQKKRYVEGLWPGVGEHRTTAMRTGEYAGKDPTHFGPPVEFRFPEGDGQAFTITAPEYAQVTVYRLIAGQRVPFPGPTVWWVEAYARAGREDPRPNEQWRRRPRGMLEKTAEAAALRSAFPEERPSQPPPKIIDAYWGEPVAMPGPNSTEPPYNPPMIDHAAEPASPAPEPEESPEAADLDPAGEPDPQEILDPPMADIPAEPAALDPHQAEAEEMLRDAYKAEFDKATELGQVAAVESHAAANPNVQGSDTLKRAIVNMGLEARARIRGSRGERANPGKEPQA